MTAAQIDGYEDVPDHVLFAGGPPDPAPTTADLHVVGAEPDTSSAGDCNLPDAWWLQRPELEQISQGAHARARSRDAVLGVTLARIAALTPPTVRLPAPVGTPGTLDVAVALIGHSGSGKSSAARVAEQLVIIDDPDVATVPLGSGEGLIEAYLGDVTEEGEDGKTRKVRRQVRRAVLAMLDEGQALADLGARKGSTLMPTIRSAWTGDRLGQANASEERRRHLAPGEYRFAMVAGFQTELATALIDDAAGGTPQRFLYLSAEDRTIPDEAPPWPGPILWAPLVHQAGPMGLDPTVNTEIRSRALARSRGETIVDPLDAHRDLSRLKVAGLLALLAERLHINTEDWELAGDVLDTSDRVRARIVWAAQHRALTAEQATATRLARRAITADEAADQRALDVMARAIARHVHRRTCDAGCRKRCITQATPGKYRAVITVDDAITEAINRDWITPDGTTYRPGKARPA